MSRKKKHDHRAPDDAQPLALAKAEDAGTLPEADRRAREEATEIPPASLPSIVEQPPVAVPKPGPLAYPIA